MRAIHIADILEKNRIFKDRHKGERCFILATGPSINKQDLKLLQGENCIVVSNFFVHPDYNIINPRYYCIAPYHHPITEEAWYAWLSEMDKATGSSAMFFGLTDYERNQRNGLFQNRDIFFLNFSAPMENILTRGIDITLPVVSPQSVTIMALQIAIYMGFKQIYLLGCDHDWILHLNQSSHFYQEEQNAAVRKGYNEWKTSSVEVELKACLSLWEQYKYLREIANKQRTEIFNATKGGLLDVFDRVDYESLFEKKALVKEDDIKPQSPYPPNISTEQILQQRAVQLANHASPLVSQGKYADAIKLLDEAMYHCPRIENLQYLRAICLWNLGRFDEAKIAAVSEIRTFPKNQVVKDVFSHILPEWEYSSDGWRIKNSVAQP